MQAGWVKLKIDQKEEKTLFLWSYSPIFTTLSLISELAVVYSASRFTISTTLSLSDERFTMSLDVKRFIWHLIVLMGRCVADEAGFMSWRSSMQTWALRAVPAFIDYRLILSDSPHRRTFICLSE